MTQKMPGKMEAEPVHVHLMYRTPAGSWRCSRPTCTAKKTKSHHTIWSPSRQHVVVF